MKVLKESKSLNEDLYEYNIDFSYIDKDGNKQEDFIDIPEEDLYTDDTFEDQIKDIIVSQSEQDIDRSTINLQEIQLGYDTMLKCEFCDEWYPDSEMKETDIGWLCDDCIDALKSRGEEIWIKN